MANEANVAGERFTDKGDAWRHFDSATLGAVIALTEGTASKLPANSKNTVEKKKNQ